MKKLTSFLPLILLLFFISCKKANTSAGNANETLPTGTTLAGGSFNSNAHLSSGTVKVIKDATNKIYLVFENFKTDNGPDLRVWLSPDNNATTYKEVGLLKAVSGNFYYTLDASFNYTANNHVLLWCKSFAVLFGNAVLQ